MPVFDVKVDAFEGPFELLFHLIRKNEMDIYDIPIAELTGQYMEFMAALNYNDMDGTSQFLLMAATLLEIKSAMLLPKPQNEENDTDPRERLTQMLLEYERFKGLAVVLRAKEAEARFFLTKPRDENLYSELTPEYKAEAGELFGEVTLNALFEMFRDVIKRRELSYDTIRYNFGTVNMDRFTISEKADEIRSILARKKRLYFSSLLSGASCIEEAITIFCAMLEMIKLMEITVSQYENFSDIIIEQASAQQVL